MIDCKRVATNLVAKNIRDVDVVMYEEGSVEIIAKINLSHNVSLQEVNYGAKNLDYELESFVKDVKKNRILESSHFDKEWSVFGNSFVKKLTVSFTDNSTETMDIVSTLLEAYWRIK